MRVLKRDGTYEDVRFDKVTERLRKLATDLDVSCDLVAQKALSEIQDGISTSKIDEITAEVAIAMTDKPDYGVLASRILVSNMHKNLGKSHERDYLFDYFGLKTLLKSYLMEGETPQDLWWRVARQVASEEDLQETYDALSFKKYIHATPTLFNSGTARPQLASCFLCSMSDSIEEIYDAKKQMAMISKYAGGIGLHIHAIRAKGSHIKGNNGRSDGLLPMLRTINADARYVNQGGRRKGAVAVYLEPWHADILEFLEMRLNQGDEESRCRDLFSALWIPDLFMKRLEANEDWSLFCPNEAPHLSDVYGDEFEVLYQRYESEGKARAKVPAQTIWKAILKSQVETGTPYMLYKDSCNRKSNQKNVGTIKSSNLCVAPETPILTRQGYKKIVDLADTWVEVWNGHEWSNVQVRKTSDAAELLKVVLDSGMTLECTREHRFWLEGSKVHTETQYLKVDDRLVGWTSPDGVYVNGPRVMSVLRTGRVSPTYCFTEPLRHLGVFNGILTGQCTEILEVSSKEETAVCNLASIALPSFVGGNSENSPPGTFDFHELQRITRLVVRNLNNVIDRGYYPVEEAKRSNLRMRPIGIGVQGLADVFAIMKMPFDSTEAAELNSKIFENIYYAALFESCALAKKHGPYSAFTGGPNGPCPAAQGILQFDHWGESVKLTVPHWNWLTDEIKQFGLRNSLLIAPMPTATTSQILGFNECFEPFTSNMYLRRTLAGEFTVMNKYLLKDLRERGLWNRRLKDQIIRNGGSVQGIPEIPEDLQRLYKTAWEISPKTIINMARDRGAFIDQSQSMNLFVEDPTNAKLSSIHMYAWKQGLKTGMYYLRTRPKAKPIQFTLEPECAMCSS